MIAWNDLPEAERQRLHKNEVSNRSRARKAGLPAVPVSVEGLWMIQRGCCSCDRCRCEVPLVIGKIVIAHRKYLKGQGSPGHVPHNVELWNGPCNADEAKQEVSDGAKFDRFKPDCVSISEKRERRASPKSKIQSRGFDNRFRKKIDGTVEKRGNQ